LRKVIVVYGCLISVLLGQEVGGKAVGIGAAWSRPTGSLANWFKPTVDLSLTYGFQYDDRWFVEYSLEAARFDRENLHGYAAGKVELLLEQIGGLVSGYYGPRWFGRLRPHLMIGGGPHYWKSMRGAIAPDSALGVPAIPRRKLEEWNLALRVGAGLEWRLFAGVTAASEINYRFLVGSLWPTMQEHIELEAVNGLQTLNFALHLHYYWQ